jgi:hypothetical protein
MAGCFAPIHLREGSRLQFVAPALGELSWERVTELIEVLPALENKLLQGPELSELVKKAIGEFIAARKLSGFPVTVHQRDLWYQDYVRWETGDSWVPRDSVRKFILFGVVFNAHYSVTVI